MTIIKRRILLIFFIILFLVLAPTIIFYANGNIFENGWNILATGGIFVRSMESGSQLFINSKLKDSTTFFTRDYFIKNLKPGSYSILVKKAGYNDWANNLEVFANRVTETSVFMLPTEVNVIEITNLLMTGKVSKPNSDYANIISLFDSVETSIRYISILSTSTGKMIQYAPGTKENPLVNRHVNLWSDNNSVYLGWKGNEDSSPKFFCKEHKESIDCQSQLKVYSFSSKISNLDFFPGESEVIIVSVDSNIYAVEAEDNANKKLQILYSGKLPDFRIDSGNIYIKDGNFLGQVEI